MLKRFAREVHVIRASHGREEVPIISTVFDEAYQKGLLVRFERPALVTGCSVVSVELPGCEIRFIRVFDLSLENFSFSR